MLSKRIVAGFCRIVKTYNLDGIVTPRTDSKISLLAIFSNLNVHMLLFARISFKILSIYLARAALALVDFE